MTAEVIRNVRPIFFSFRHIQIIKTSIRKLFTIFKLIVNNIGIFSNGCQNQIPRFPNLYDYHKTMTVPVKLNRSEVFSWKILIINGKIG